ncbi:MAG: hypothetical protein ACE5O2_04955 [Armatimonadota bacterium]
MNMTRWRALCLVCHSAAWSLAALAIVAVSASLGWACDIPVYLYSLQRWARDPYPVYYFYRDVEDAADADANRRLDELSEGTRGHVNLWFRRIDVADIESGELVGPIQDLWAKHESQPLPFHVILTPRGTELFVGRLDLTAVEALIASPQTANAVRQLSVGKQGVLLLLTGPDEQENRDASEVVSAAIADAKQRGLDVGVVTVLRDDPKERWLIRQLLEIEDDLADLQAPMVFGMFGRGHALEPCLGAGITDENLMQVVRFINGPCSCEIKAQNPGMDLLTNWDWTTHVASLPVPDAQPFRSALYDILIVEEPSVEPESAADVAAPSAGEQAAPEQPAGPSTDAAQPAIESADVAPPAKVEKPEASADEPQSADEEQPEPERVAPPEEPKAIQRMASATGAPAATPAAGEKSLSRVPDFVSRPPTYRQPARAEPEQGPSLGSVLGVRIGLAVAAGVVVVLVIGLAIVRARRDVG